MSCDGSLDKLLVWEKDTCVAYLHQTPIIAGTVVVTHRNRVNKMPTDQEYMELMFACKTVSCKLKDKLGVHRCAMVIDNKCDVTAARGKRHDADRGTAFFSHALVIPMDGLSEVWVSIVTPEKVFFNDQYPGYVTSRDGPRAADADLDKVQAAILSAYSGSKTPHLSPDKTFHGDQDDTNLFACIVRGELQQWRIWENDRSIAVLTPYPNTPGFTVVVPRRHLSSDILGLRDEDYESIMLDAWEVGRQVQAGVKAGSFAIICEGMEIDYAHVKIVPLYKIQ